MALRLAHGSSPGGSSLAGGDPSPTGLAAHRGATGGPGPGRVVTAAVVAGALSGAPSTAHALVTGRSPLDATRAAGNLVLPADAPGRHLVAAGAAVHAALSLGWTAVLVRVLPRRHPRAWGAVAGAAIAALDLGTVGRRRPLPAALPVAPQVADHVAFGLLVGAVVKHGMGQPGGGPAR